MGNSLLVGIAFFILPSFAVSQGATQFQDLLTVGTQPPDAASLSKFGNIPVNYSTGSTSISIPIFEINVGKTKIPLTLDYHTGGIRVDETSSMVGIGWALSGIAEISRNVVGLPDESDGGYLSTPSFDSLYNDWISGGVYGTTIDDQFATFLNNFRIGAAETEPDIYSYSINGESGKFILKRDGTVMQIPVTNSIINQTTGFQITDAKGTVYVFDIIEHTIIPKLSATQTYAGRWRLSKIIDPNTVDTVFFSYASSCGYNTESYYNYTYSLGYGPDCSTPNLSPTAINYHGENFTVSTIEHPDELFPSEIDWRGGKIVFQNSCDRQDKASEQRLSSVNVYNNAKQSAILIKTVKLYQSYFYSDLTGDSAHDERNYRLRLDSVSFLPVTATGQPETYRMTYNPGPIASRESVAQDLWGFNNGQFTNPTSMPNQTVVFNSVLTDIGEANRNPDSASMLACSIQSIQYPTGGRSVFAFEPHKYFTNKDSTAGETVSCAANGAEQSSSQITFTPDSNGSFYTLTYSFTSYDYSGVTDRPRITITDQVTGEQILLSSNIDPSQSLNNYGNPSPWSPVLGHTYLIVTDIYTNTVSQVSASLTINWIDTYDVNLIALGAGLRVKSVTNYDADGKFISEDLYQYGLGENGLGQVVTPPTYLLVNSEATTYKCGYFSSSDGLGPEGDGCAEASGNPGVTYYANPVYPASQFCGSPILYPAVTKYQVDSVGNTNGKSVFTYQVFDDQSGFASTNYSRVGVLLITDLWRNGYLTSQLDYKYIASSQSYQLIHQKVNNYQPYRQQTLSGLKLKNNYNWNTTQCYLESMAAANQDYLLVQIPINSGAMLAQSASDTVYDDAGNKLGSTISYLYSDTTHLFPTSQTRYDSKNYPRITNFEYPHDSSGVPVYASMLARNIISPIIFKQETYNGSQTILEKVHYSNWLGNSTLFEPSTIDQQVGAYPLETRLQFVSFDRYGNIIQQRKVGDVNQSYIWDYSSAYPIAKCINADSASVAYTSFESDGSGGWSIGSGNVDTTQGITGQNSYNLSGTISKSGLNSANTYFVSYWSQNGSYSVTGTISGYPTQGKTEVINGISWTLYVHKVTGQSTVSISGSGHIDELRLYPANALMTTYTYAPLVGMTSQTDVGNRVSYYEYDALARLKRVRDQDYNILKTFDYQYLAPGGCGSGCSILAMQTFIGTNTPGYPVGVFDIHGNLVGNATGASSYVSLWNSDTADSHIGTLGTGSDSLHFNLSVNSGQTAPANVMGLRYYQYDLAWNKVDGIENYNGAYVDFGDGTHMQLPRTNTVGDTVYQMPPNTTRVGFSGQWEGTYWFIHTYPDSSLKTITIYHNDVAITTGLDNGTDPATSLTKVQNVRGNFPQTLQQIGGSCYQQPGALTVANVTNWNSLSSVAGFWAHCGDHVNPSLNLSYSQDFMANNRNLQTINTTNLYLYQSGYWDSTFKLTRLKSNWNTYFTNLQDIEICDAHWNREDLSALTHLSTFDLLPDNQSHSNDSTSNPNIPIPASAIDSILNQIAAGAGQNVSNGVIWILTGGGTGRTSASNAAVSALDAKGWQVYIDNVQQ